MINGIEYINKDIFIEEIVNKITENRLDVQEKLHNRPDDIHAAMLRGRLRGIADCLEIINEARNGEGS